MYRNSICNVGVSRLQYLTKSVKLAGQCHGPEIAPCISVLSEMIMLRYASSCIIISLRGTLITNLCNFGVQSVGPKVRAFVTTPAVHPGITGKHQPCAPHLQFYKIFILAGSLHFVRVGLGGPDGPVAHFTSSGHVPISQEPSSSIAFQAQGVGLVGWPQLVQALFIQALPCWSCRCGGEPGRTCAACPGQACCSAAVPRWSGWWQTCAATSPPAVHMC